MPASPPLGGLNEAEYGLPFTPTDRVIPPFEFHQTQLSGGDEAVVQTLKSVFKFIALGLIAATASKLVVRVATALTAVARAFSSVVKREAVAATPVVA
jgi:hypothetical protein